MLYSRVKSESGTGLANVNAPRNTNASLFTTALCACLGLLVVGTPLQARPLVEAAGESRFEYASTIRSGFEASVVASLRELKIDDRWLPDSAAKATVPPREVCRQTSKPLTDINRVLTVTRLPRSALSDSPAKPPKAV